MRIFVEGTPVFMQRTGVGQYTKNLLEALLKFDQKNRYTIFGFLFIGKRAPERPITGFKNVDYKMIRYLPSKVFNATTRKLTAPPIDLLLGSKPDLFFFPNFVRYPLLFGAKAIVVVYDLSYVKTGEFTAKRNREYLLRYVPRSVKRAEHVVTISQNSKREIMETYGVPEEKITVATPAIDHDHFYPRPVSQIDNIRKKFRISKPYIFYTGTLEPRKNVNGILDAYATLPKDVQDRYSLVLAGGKGWLDQGIKSRLKELAALDIIATGYVADEELPGLYSGASVFVYPSFYEGFGMPPLEAMACGVPVITANNSSLPEVVGDAGILIDAADTKALARNIQDVLNDESLAKALKSKGIAQAKRFTWEESGRKVYEIIKAMEV